MGLINTISVMYWNGNESYLSLPQQAFVQDKMWVLDKRIYVRLWTTLGESFVSRQKYVNFGAFFLYPVELLHKIDIVNELNIVS